MKEYSLKLEISCKLSRNQPTRLWLHDFARIRSRTGVSNTQPTGRMWPARAFCAARDACCEISIIII